MGTVATAAPFAERQLGLVTRTQLLDAGVKPKTVDEAVRTGVLLHQARGVYRLPGAPLTAPSRLLAEVLALGHGALLSHRTAAWLWGLAPAPVRHEVSVPRGRRRRSGPLIVHESRDLHLVVPGRIDGLPVTDVGRTVLDCASEPEFDLELLVDEARRRHGISRSLLPSVVVAHARAGRPGIDRLRRLVEEVELPASDFERLVTRWLAASGVPAWTFHHRLVVPTFGPVELDIAWPECRVALELEGADHRDRRLVHDRDTARQNALAADGWIVLRVTYRRWLQEPAAVLAEITSVLDGSSARPASPAPASLG